jgi:microcystin-dependent protein
MATNNFGFQTLTGSERAGYSSINSLISSIDSVLYTASTGIADGGSAVGQLLRWNGTTWAAGTIDGTSIDNNAVALGTKTTGSYVKTLLGTANQVAVSSNDVESADVTISLVSSAILPGSPTVAAAPDFDPNYAPDNKIADTDFVMDALSYAQTGTSITLGGTYLSGAASSANIVVGSIPKDRLSSSAQEWLAPTGALMPFAGSTVPSGWYLCDGRAWGVSGAPSSGSALHTAISGNFPTGLPDLRGRVPLGAGTGAGLTARTIADTIGNETHTLSTGELASHQHTGTTGTESAGHTHAIDHNHGTANTGEAGAHGHNASTSGQMFYGAGANAAVVGASVNSGGTGQAAPVDVSNVGNHAHAFDMPAFTGNSGPVSATHTHSFTSANAGSGTAHNNMQPSLVLNYIIKG